MIVDCALRVVGRRVRFRPRHAADDDEGAFGRHLEHDRARRRALRLDQAQIAADPEARGGAARRQARDRQLGRHDELRARRRAPGPSRVFVTVAVTVEVLPIVTGVAAVISSLRSARGSTVVFDRKSFGGGSVLTLVVADVDLDLDLADLELVVA